MKVLVTSNETDPRIYEGNDLKDMLRTIARHYSYNQFSNEALEENEMSWDELDSEMMIQEIESANGDGCQYISIFLVEGELTTLI